ncbi:MAG: methyltransferase domain-containing protein [Candidatus Caldarchaeum sp.]
MTEPYHPREDTFLTIDCVAKASHVQVAAEVGCGTGEVLKALAEKSDDIIGIDIDPEALKIAADSLTNLKPRLNLLNASLLPLRPHSLDMVVANPPYLPDEPGLHDPSIHGGPRGVELAEQIVEHSSKALRKQGILVLTASSLSAVDDLLSKASLKGFKLLHKLVLKSFFETVFCFIFTLSDAQR